LELSWDKYLVLGGFLELPCPKRKQNNEQNNHQKSNQDDSIYGERGAFKKYDFRVELHNGGSLVIARVVGDRSLDNKAQSVI
jgi:hypothetical protein